LQYSTVQYSTVQYSTVHYITVQYSTVHYITVQYSTQGRVMKQNLQKLNQTQVLPEVAMFT